MNKLDEPKVSSSKVPSDTSRIKGFSDGVFAVIITITVLDIHAPTASSLQGFIALAPLFLAYALSFTNLAIYWNNHHHLLYTMKGVRGSIMWANLNLLFWISLIPFSTAWIGEFPNKLLPVLAYGIVLLFSALAYFLLQETILHYETKNSLLRKALKGDKKGIFSLVVLILGILSAFIAPWVAYIFYLVIVLIWVIPDRRLESILGD